jgi:cobalt-zinc-cadmium efflux system membrane fusion protein
MFDSGVAMKYLAQISGLLCLAAVMAGCGGHSAETASPAPPPAQQGEVYVSSDPRGIQVVTAAEKSVPDLLVTPAHVEADPTRVIHVFAPVGGRLTAINVRPGDHVEKGAIIAQLDSGDVAGALASYQAAKANADLKERALNRASELYDHHAIPQKDFEQAQADQAAAQSALNQARDQARILGVDPSSSVWSSHVDVRAPRAGVVLDVSAAAGEFSKSLEATDPLCTIADIEAVWAVGDVMESDVAAVRLGAQAQISMNAYPGQTWQGTIAAAGDVIDPMTHTMKVRVVLPNPGLRLKPDMYGTLSVVRSTSQQVVLPGSAVVREGATAYVFVQQAENRFVRRDVTLGRSTGNQIVVKSGLKPGELVVSQGALLLRAAS